MENSVWRQDPVEELNLSRVTGDELRVKGEIHRAIGR